MHPLGVAVWVKSTDSGYLVTVDFSLFLPRTCRWNLSAIETYKFDLRSFHRAELRPLTKAIKRPPKAIYISEGGQLAVGVALSIGYQGAGLVVFVT